MARRYYSSTAVATQLSAAVNATATAITLGSTQGFPTTFPFTLILDEGQLNEEIVNCTNLSGGTATIERGQDGTYGTAHAAAAVVRHGLSARDLREPNEHIAAEAGVHGVTASLVGTSDAQTLTNKTMSGETNSFSAIPSGAVVGLQGAIDGVTAAQTAANAAKAVTDAATPNTNANTLVKRDSGGRFLVPSPTAGTNPATKSYADDVLTAAKAYTDQQAATAVVKGGQSTVTISNYSGSRTITHGMGGTPAAVTATLIGTAGALNYMSVKIASISSSQFEVRVYYFGDLNGQASPSTTVSFAWMAVR